MPSSTHSAFVTWLGALNKCVVYLHLHLIIVSALQSSYLINSQNQIDSSFKNNRIIDYIRL